eukprot:CAMPEP_0202410824 /NCGR_PEP_ID=MMETSP1128-20130828/20010_1 /ASSEMBLY_ACC=CAM_ASM_000463 /TAXON_ID=3047 /ORGANISM="Dunaliella tertiolecta, Strain CCMP1320" /LENGTH=33 /DNA_ID= /DNA_START= /DNA_END= /DNA_ORIENTATION=
MQCLGRNGWGVKGHHAWDVKGLGCNAWDTMPGR